MKERKGAVTEPIPDGADYDTLVNRLAARLAENLVRTPLTPDHLSWLGLGLGLTAGVLFAIGDRPAVDGGAVLFILAVFMDELDGALARHTGQITRFGNNLDYVAGTLSFCALFVGAGIGARHLIGAWGPTLGLVAAAAALLAMRLRMGMEDRHGRAAVRHLRFGPFELKDGIYLIGPVTWAGGFDWFFVAAALGVCVFAVCTLWQRRLWLKGVRR
jgi:phosphatidylglycerophosphate synthase